MKIESISSRDVRQQLADLLNRVLYANEHFLISKHGKPVAAIISIEELELLKRVMSEGLESKEEAAAEMASIS